MSADAPRASKATLSNAARRVIARAYGVRILALALGGIAVSGVFYRRGVPVPVWVLLSLHVLVWPHVAWWMTRRSPDPVAANRRCFLGDAAVIGVWIALMAFNLLPAVLLVTMTAMTLIATEGRKLLERGMALQALACCMAWAANNLAFSPHSDTFEMLMSLPLQVLFPVTLGFITYGLAQRVRRQNRVLLEMSTTDGLSGLFNRRHWQDVVDVLLAGRNRETAAMLLLDIDNFKQINDQHGHTVGDEVIRMVGAVIHDSVREGDVAGRYGGDEFCVVLRGADAQVAEQVAERIRSRVACTLVAGVPGLHCTMSIGVASGGAEIRDVREWVKTADAALYSAKLAGRNRFVVVS